MHLSLQSGARNRETAAENWISKGRCVAFQLSQKNTHFCWNLVTCMLHDACFQWSFLSQREEFMAFSYLFFHVRRWFHSISLHWRSGRIVSTFNNCDTSTTWSYIWIYRGCLLPSLQRRSEHATMCHFPKNLLDPRTTNKKTTWFYMVFTPSQHGKPTNQPFSH